MVFYRHMKQNFLEAYKNLNTQQKTAVDAIDGPVMVVAGPGTGKTQILTLRIANILDKTDTQPSSILCLTFTRSGVMAMRERLEKYIGTTARDVIITTFHSFAISLVEKNFALLDFSTTPQLLDDNQSVLLVDELLQQRDWEYLRPRTDPTKYFNDLRSLISILKRERLTPEQFLASIEKDIKELLDDPASISSRGPSKGQIKKEIEKKIESLNRTKEVVAFYEQYEQLKKDSDFMDYDDVLEYAVQLVQEFESVRADVQENHQYILVDEHQDSSGVQNQFLKSVWSDVERPDIFVVGDDRQLIYGFSGANIDYFTEFKTAFGTAELVTLTENYRSTKPILGLADELLKSSVTDESLNSNYNGEAEHVTLSEFNYERDEIIGAGLHFKKLIEQGENSDECALLLPKNRHVKQASQLLREMGVPVVSEQNVSLLELPKTQGLLRILSLVHNPYNNIELVQAMLDITSNIPPFQAHTFLKNSKKPDNITIDDLIKVGDEQGMFADENPIVVFGKKLHHWIETLSHEKVSHIVSIIGNELLIESANNHDKMLESIEIVRSFLHASSAWEEKNPSGNLAEFIDYFNRFITYKNTIEIARLGNMKGVRVMTLHRSKGLEYRHVWIGHMNQEVIMSTKVSAFTLPELVKSKIEERSVLTAKRELYVAITRAKEFCTISYAQKRNDGSSLQLAHIIQDLSDEQFIKTTGVDNELLIIKDNPRHYATFATLLKDSDLTESIAEFVKERFTETRISVSMLNNFYECPWKWYFRNFLKLPDVKGVSLALGSAVHNTIEHILKMKTLLGENEIREFVVEALKKEGIINQVDLNTLTKDAETAIGNWIKGFYNELAKDYTTERSVSFKDKQFPNLSHYGKIDLTERFSDGTIIVTDFKTGKSKTGSMIEKRDEEGRLSGLMRQLAMYSYLIYGAEKNDVTESRLLFLEEDLGNKNSLYTTRITGEHVELLVKDIKDYQDLLLSGDWMNRPCNSKGFGNTECEHCARIQKLLEK